MYKKCKVVMLATAKATWPNCIWLGRISGQLRVDHSYDYSPRSQAPTEDSMLPQHLYILSDDEIKEGDWCYGLLKGNLKLFQYKKKYGEMLTPKKIIATTDSSLRILKSHAIHEVGDIIKVPLIPALSACSLIVA